MLVKKMRAISILLIIYSFNRVCESLEVNNLTNIRCSDDPKRCSQISNSKCSYGYCVCLPNYSVKTETKTGVKCEQITDTKQSIDNFTSKSQYFLIGKYETFGVTKDINTTKSVDTECQSNIICKTYSEHEIIFISGFSLFLILIIILVLWIRFRPNNSWTSPLPSAPAVVVTVPSAVVIKMTDL
jgi:hypothetical protein